MNIPFEIGQIVYWHGGHGPILEIHITRRKQFALVEDITFTSPVPTSEKRLYKKFSELYSTLSDQQADYFYDEIDRH